MKLNADELENQPDFRNVNDPNAWLYYIRNHSVMAYGVREEEQALRMYHYLIDALNCMDNHAAEWTWSRN